VLEEAICRAPCCATRLCRQRRFGEGRTSAHLWPRDAALVHSRSVSKFFFFLTMNEMELRRRGKAHASARARPHTPHVVAPHSPAALTRALACTRTQLDTQRQRRAALEEAAARSCWQRGSGAAAWFAGAHTRLLCRVMCDVELLCVYARTVRALPRRWSFSILPSLNPSLSLTHSLSRAHSLSAQTRNKERESDNSDGGARTPCNRAWEAQCRTYRVITGA